MKILRVLLIILGILFVLIGIGGAVLSPQIPSYECMSAENINKGAERSAKAAEAAKGTPQEAELQAKAKADAEMAAQWTKSCSNLRSTANFTFYLALGITVVGLLIVIAGILRKTGPRS
jgi:cbb3-type cytochrome oxidase cytochrome c subunit